MKNPIALILTGSVFALLSTVPAAALGIPAQPVTDINPVGDSNPDHITFSSDRLYFTATDKKGNTGIYVKKLTKNALGDNDLVLNRKPTLIRNLTKRGVTKVADNFVRAFETNVSDKLFFHVRGEGLYTSKGTAMSTIRLLTFDSRTSQEGFSFDPNVTPFYTGDTAHGLGVVGAVFAGRSAKEGVEPFVSNGKPGKKNTHIVRDINPGKNGSFPYSFLARPSGTAPDQLYFGAFGPTNFYQLYRTTQQNAATTAEIVVSRTDSIDNNLATAPYGIVLAGNDVIFGGGNDLNDTNSEVGFFNTTTLQFSYLTNTNVNPYSFVTGGEDNGGNVFFGAFDATNGFEPWSANSFGPSAGIRANINNGNASSSPNNFKEFGSEVYWIANDGSGTHLYRDESFDSPGKIVTTTNANIAVTTNAEYTAVLDGSGSGNIYFVGDDGTGPTLWKVANQFGSEQAVQVKTGQGNVIKNPSHFGVAVHLAGATSIARLYFRCDGDGTEFAGKGQELWVYEE